MGKQNIRALPFHCEPMSFSVLERKKYWYNLIIYMDTFNTAIMKIAIFWKCLLIENIYSGIFAIIIFVINYYLYNILLYLRSIDAKNVKGRHSLQMTFFTATDKYHVTCNYLWIFHRDAYIYIPEIVWLRVWTCFTIMEISCKYKCSLPESVTFMAPPNNIWYRPPLNENLIRRHPATQLVQFSR